MSNRALSPMMVGRQAQLAELNEYLARARAGAGQIVFLAGEAGVGKTRLLREFIRGLEPASGVIIYAGSCYDEQPAPAYGPFAELLRALAAAPEASGYPEAGGPGAGDLRRLMPELSLAPDEAPADTQGDRRRLFQAIYQVLRPREGRTHVLLLEDLHWSDQASQDLLHYVARAVERDRVLIVGTFRTDEMRRLHPLGALIARLTRDRRYNEIRVAPLSRAELAQMLDVTLGAPPPPELLLALYERTEGNPFFAEEVLESLIEHGRLDGLTDDPAPGRPLALTIPLSIKDSILRRVADLDPTTAMVLRAAAVVGRRFDFELLLRLTGLDEGELLRSLATLIERQLVAEEAGEVEDRYRFRHELIREAVYTEMLRREQRRRHQEVLLALEELHAANPDAVADQLAYHAINARAAAQAARYSQRAGDKAAAVHAYREALGHYEAALEAGEQGEQFDERWRADLLARIGHVAYMVGDLARCAEHWREAQPIYERLGDRRRVADVLRWLGRVAWEQHDRAGAFAQTRAALATLEGEPVCRELAMATSALSHLYMLSIFEAPESIEPCISWGRQALAMAEELGDDAVICHALNNIGVGLVKAGEIDAGLSHLERSMAIARAADLPADVGRAYVNLGGQLLQAGRNEQALAVFREGWEYVAAHGHIHGSSKVLAGLVSTELELGEWVALDARIEGVLRADYPGPPEDRAMIQYIRALLAWARGNVNEARNLMEGLLSSAVERDYTLHIQHMLIFIYRALGMMDRAVALADQLVAEARRAGTFQQLALKLSAPAEIYLDVGRRAEALEIIAAQEALLPAPNCEGPNGAIVAEMRGLAAMEHDPRAAAALMAQAAEIWGQLGRPLDIVRLHRRRAAALLRAGSPADRAEAARSLAVARPIAERLGAGYELGRIAALEQPEPARAPAPPPRSPDGLTPRELEVLALITRGYSNRAIAETLIISEKTAEVHVRNILGKLGLTSRTQAATYALERGIVALPTSP